MSTSNNISSGGIATFTVKVNGATVPDELSVYAIHVEKRVNRISSAKITILDGDPTVQDFTASSSATFVPGGTISIEAGYDNTNSVIFKGIIMSQTVRVDSLIGSALEVECRDEAVKMIVGRKSLTYSKQNGDKTIDGNKPFNSRRH